MEYLRGIDNGGTVTKAAVYTTGGEEVAVACRKTETLYPKLSHIERDLNEFRAANAQVIREWGPARGHQPCRDHGCRCCGARMWPVHGGRPGRARGNGIISTDSRVSGYVQKWYAEGTFERVLPNMCGSIRPAQPAALLPWFRDNAPEALRRTSAVLSSSCFIGMRGWHKKAHLLCAIFEGVAGGAAKSSVWAQMFADVLQMPMEITATEELGALGEAICAGVGSGIFASFPQAISHMVRIVKVVELDPVLPLVYEEKYVRCQSHIAALRNVWDRRRGELKNPDKEGRHNDRAHEVRQGQRERWAEGRPRSRGS
jgi:sugar (pentulose or hexulose) kinase